MYYIDSSGDVKGGADIQLYTDYGLGTQRSAYASNWVRGTSSYHWVGGGTPSELTVYFSTDVYIDISYYGYALNYLGNSPASCSCQAYTQGGGNSTIFGFYPYGYGSGTANSEGGSSAGNDWYGIEPATDDSDAYQPSSKEGSCAGHLVISGTAHADYADTPSGLYFSATASLDGASYVQGQITINGSPHFGGFNAGAGHEIYGTCSVDLDGDIDDLQ